MARLQLTSVYCNRRVVLIPHLKCRVFAMQKCAQNGYKDKWWWNWCSLTTRWELGQVHDSGWNMIAWWHSMTRTPMIFGYIHDIGIDRLKASDHYCNEQFMESFSSASYSKCDDDRAWSSHLENWDTTYDRSGRLHKTSWRMVRQVRLAHEETLHDGTAQSVVNEETPRDRSGRPDIDSQEEAEPQHFVVGNDETELELSVESRSFVSCVNDQVRKRQQKISDVAEDGEEHSGIFMVVTKDSAVLYLRDWCLSNLSIWKGESFMEISVINLWKSHQSSAHEGLRLFDSVLCLGKIFQKSWI